MAITSKPLSSADGNQVLRYIYNPDSGAIAAEGWVTGAVGRKIVRTATSATVDEFEFFEGSTSLMVLQVTYSDAAHSDVDEVERTA